jgi:hypothetical protein
VRVTACGLIAEDGLWSEMKMTKHKKLIWVLSYTDKANRKHFLGSYPSREEAEQTAQEEFGHPHKQINVKGYDSALLMGAAPLVKPRPRPLNLEWDTAA